VGETRLKFLAVKLCMALIVMLLGSAAHSQTADFTVSVAQGCVPLSGVNFTDISSGGTVLSRDWDLGNGTVIPNGAVTVGTNYLTANTFTVTLTVYFSGGITRTASKTVVVHPKPIADFKSSDTVGCVPHSASFTDLSTTATGTITGWQWDFGAGGSIAPSPTFIYNNPGTYQVSLIVKNNWGCSSPAATKNAYIKVYPKPVAGFTSSPVSSCDTPFTVNFTNTTTGSGPITYEWNFGDGSPVVTTLNASHTYKTYGRFTVTLKAILGNNCSNTYSSFFYNDIWVGKPTPVITVAPDEVCINTSTFLSGTATPASLAYGYKWIFPYNNSVQFGQSINHSFTATGLLEVILVSYTYYNCTDTVRKFINVKPGPQVNFSANRVAGCAVPFAVQFTPATTPATGLAYEWNFGDGGTSTLINPSHNYTYQGSFTVTLKVTDTTIPNGCSATETKNSYINIRIPNVNFTYVPPAGCRPLPVLVTAQLTNMIDAVDTLIWNFGDGNIDTITNGALIHGHLYTAAGVFGIQLTLITASGCRYSSIVKYVSVIDICDDDGSGGGGGGGGGFLLLKNCLNKYEVLFTDTVSNSTVQEWDFGDGTIVNTGILNPITHTYTPPQKTYLVKVKRINNTTGVVSTGEKNVIIIDEKANFAPDITDICQNKTVNFKTIGIDSSKIKKYSWRFGDGTPLYVIDNLTYYNTYGLWLNGNTSHTYATNGTFYVKLYIEDKLGCVDSFQYPVPITVQGPIPGFRATNLTSCDVQQLVTFTDTSKQNGATPIVEWKWNFGDGSPVYTTTVDTPITHLYTNTNYINFRTVTLTIKDAIGCEAPVSKTSYVKGYRPKADFFSYNTLQCGTYSVFLYNFSLAYNATYTWYYGDGNSSNGYYGIHTYTTEGNYDIKLVATDENGCKDSLTRPAYINIVKPKAGFRVGDTTQCAPAAISFFDSSQYAVSYEWNFGDGGTGSVDKDPAPHIYANPGFYKVTLKIKSVNNCVDSISQWIRVRGPIGTLDALPGFGCKPYLFNAKVTGSFISTYAWDFGDGTPVNASVSDSVVAHTYVNAGKYLPNVVLVSPEGCPYTLKLSDTLVVDSARAFFNPLSSVFCGNGTVTFNNLSKVPAFSSITNYTWNFGDGGPVDNSPNPPPHNYGPGNYNVSLNIKSQYGCDKTFTQPLAVVVHPLPVATILGDSIRCKTGFYEYVGSVVSADAIQTFEWTVNGNAVSSTPNLAYNFAAGNYVIGLKVKTVNNCTHTAFRNIIVDSVKADFSVLNPVRCANDLNVSFTNLSGSQFGITNYIWDFGDNTGSYAQNPPVHTYPGYGSYNVSLLIKTVHSCLDSFKITPAVVINPLPVAVILGDSIRCKPGVYDYTSSIVSIDPIQNYEWKVNGNVVSGNPNLNYNFAAGNYTVGLKVKTNNNCTHEVQRTIIIDSVTAKFSVLNPIRCADDLNVSFTNLSGSQFGITNYIWDFGDNTGSYAQNPPVHTYPGYGSYNLSLNVKSVHGCLDSFKITPAVVINPLPVAAILGDSIRCKPGLYSYTSSVVSIDPIQNYEWKVNGSVVSSNQNLNYNFAAGNYTIGLKVKTNNNCTHEVQRTIIIDSVTAKFSVLNPIRCADDLNVNFTNLSGSKFGIADYLWNFGDNTTSILQNPPVHTYPGYGSYNVSLNVKSIHGCPDSFKITPAVVINPLPVAAILGDSIRCKPGVYDYTSSIVSIDPIQNYEWKVNGNVVSSNQNLNYNFAAGNYTIGLKVKTNNNCTHEVLRNIIVDSVKANFSIERPVRCGNNDVTVNFTNLSGGKFPINFYEWSFGDGQFSNSVNPTHNYPGPGSYNVRLICRSIHGCTDTFTLPQAVIIYPGPVVMVTGIAEKCMNSSITFTSQVQSQDVISGYQWRVNNIPAGTADTLTYFFATAGNYVVTLAVSTQNGCTVIQTKNVTIRPLPVPAAAPNTTLCEGASVTLQAGDGVTYAWTPAATLQNANTATPTARPLQNTRYYATVTNQYGCVQTDSVLIKIDTKVNMLTPPNVATCRGTAVTLAAGGNASQFMWSPAAGLSNPNSAITQANPTNTTQYRVIGVSNNVCPSDTGYVTVTVGDIPTVNLGPDLDVESGRNITLTPVTTGGVTQYAWSPATGLSCTTCPQSLFVADKNITYRLKVTTQYGCTATDDINVVVRCGKGSVYVPGGFTPNGDGVNDIFYVSGYGIARVKVFSVFDRWGKRVFHKENIPAGNTAHGWDGKVNGAIVPTSTTFVYVVQVECAEGKLLLLKGTIILIR
jgi:gliding motility-associated-like protein